MDHVNVGILGAGTVGGGVYQAIRRNGKLLASRLGVDIRISRISAKEIDEPRAVDVPHSLITTDWKSVVEAPDTQIIVELVGGTTVARQMVSAALELGKPVVTANKALLSAHGEELFAKAEKHGANLYYEASVAGGIPVIKALREGLIANRIGNIYGILNGTCNYILTRMKREGAEFDDVLADAQRQGFAEADPSLDVDGFDTLHKTGILASLAHGFWINPGQIHCEGIRFISKLDIQFAEQLGYSIKLLGVVKSVQERKGVRRGSGSKIQVYVCPVMVPEAHILASVNEVFNAVFVRGDVVGDTLYYGRGAGQDPTASAVVSDLADAARDLKFKSSNRIPAFVPHEVEGAVVPMDEVVSKYYIRLSVIDKPGVLAKISAVFAEGDIGIASVIQPRSDEGNVVPLIMMTHDAANLPMSNALKKISKLSVVKGEPVMIRIEDLS